MKLAKYFMFQKTEDPTNPFKIKIYFKKGFSVMNFKY